MKRHLPEGSFARLSARCLAAAGALYFFEMALVGTTHYSSSGVFGDEHFLAFLREVAQWGALPLGFAQAASFAAWPLAFVLGACGCVLLSLGSARARFAGGLAGALAVTFLHLRNPLLSNSSDVLLGQLFVLTALLSLIPCARLSRAALAGYGLLVYAGSVAFKVKSSHWWPEFSALGRALRTRDIARPPGTWLAEVLPESALSVFTFGALAGELLAPLAIFGVCLATCLKTSQTKASRRTVQAAALSLVLLHVGILVLLDIGPFPWICLALWVPFLFEPSTPPLREPAARLWTALPGGVFIAACAVSLVAAVSGSATALYGRAGFALYLLHLKQNWSMFSPAPTHSTRYEVRATLPDGTGRTLPLEPPGASSFDNVGTASYAGKVYWDVFWSNPWRAQRSHGAIPAGATERGPSEKDEPGIDRELGHALALRYCVGALDTGVPLRIVLGAIRTAHGSASSERVEIGRASCPLP